MNLDAHLLLVHGVGILHVVGLYLAVFERDSVAYLLQVVCRDVLVKMHMVYFLLEELGVCELAGHVAVVGEQQHARGIAVEPAHGIDALGASVLHKVHHGLALLRVVACGNIVLGLVEQHVDLLLKRHRLVVELHLVRPQHLGAQLGHHGAIYRHYTCLYEFVGLAAAAHTCICQVLVESHGLVGVDAVVLIVDALLETGLGVRREAPALRAEAALAVVVAATLLVAPLAVVAIALPAAGVVSAALLVAALAVVAVALALVVVVLLVSSGAVASVVAALLVATLAVAAAVVAALLVTALAVVVSATLLVASAVAV